MFKKKFKVRVCHFGRDKYTVQYAHYRFIPIYHSLCYWFSQTLTGNTECWSTRLLSCKGAEALAKTLNSIEDVNKYYKPYDKERTKFLEDKDKYFNRNVPYTSKQIK